MYSETALLLIEIEAQVLHNFAVSVAEATHQSCPSLAFIRSELWRRLHTPLIEAEYRSIL